MRNPILSLQPDASLATEGLVLADGGGASIRVPSGQRHRSKRRRRRVYKPAVANISVAIQPTGHYFPKNPAGNITAAYPATTASV